MRIRRVGALLDVVRAEADSFQMQRVYVLLCYFALLAACGGAAYRVPPSRLQGIMQTRVLAESTSKLYYDLYLPAERRAAPLVMLGHGWSGTRMDMAELALAATDAGFVVVAPSFPGGVFPSHEHNAAVFVRLANHLRAESVHDRALLGRLDGRVVYTGYSAGGLVALLASHRDPGASFYVGVDPVDLSAQGLAVARNTSVRAVGLFADAQACNANGSGVPMLSALRGEKTLLRIVGANHCAAAFSNDGGSCASFCGPSATAGTHGLFESLFVEALLALRDGRTLRASESGVVVITPASARR